MSDQKKMDEFLQRSFSDYSPDVPAHIWDNIAAGRKKKKPVAFWFNKSNLLILAAALIAVTGTAIWMAQKNNIQNIAPVQDNSRQNEPAITAASVPTKNDAASIGKNEAPVVTAGSNLDNEKLSASDNGFAKENNSVKDIVTNSPAVSTGRLANDATNNSNNQPGALHRNNKKRYIKKGSTSSTQVIFAAEESTDEIMGNNDPAPPTEQRTGLLQPSKEAIAIHSQGITRPSTVISNITLRIPDCPAAEKDAAGNKSYAEFYLGPDYAFKKYSDTGNSQLVQKRKESLHFRSAYSAGIRYTKVFGNGMSIRAGINFSQINEKFSFIKDNVVQLVYVINPQGDTTSRYYVRGTRYSNTYNHYRTIDVPVVVGYELGNGRLHANINAGVVINIYSWQTGQTLDDNYMPVSISTGKESNAAYQYKTNVGLGFTGALSLYYKLNDRFHLLAEPYCRFNLSPMNRENGSLQEKFSSIGLRLGLRMDF